VRLVPAAAFLVIGGVVIAAALFAQPPEGPTPPPGRPNGPPGGGAFFFRFPGGPGGPGQGQQNPTAALLGMPDVQAELKFSAEQKEAITKAIADSQKVVQEAFSGLDPRQLGELSEEERNRRVNEARTKADDANKAAEKVFGETLSKQQAARLDQLRLQREGASAILKPETVKSLGLTEKQVKQLTEVQARSFAGMGPAVVSSQAQADLLAVLSTEQQTKWAELSGPAFQFSAPPAGGGFGRGPGGPGFGPPGAGGPGGPGGRDREVVKQFDKNEDGWLNNDERKLAREFLKTQPRPGGPGGGPGLGPPGGGPGGPGGAGRPGGGPGGPLGGPGGGSPGFGRREPGKPGPKVDLSSVTPITDAPLYAPNVVRTLFLEFENADWEEELESFHGTDVEVPATLTVDGKKYPHVGIHFRGMSSYGMIPRGSKRSFNLSLDFLQRDQRLYGYKTLNLLNANDDPTFLHTFLFSHISRQFIPAPKANLVKVVVNGESWGVYVNAQQFDKVFLAENYPSSKGTRWKVSGSPGGGGSLAYLGEKIASYERVYEMKTSDGEKSWKALIQLCKTLNETPVEELEKAIEPLLDVKGALWFLALDNALVNSDGYWIRASDYSLFLDEKGKFHVIAHDMNETLMPGMGPGLGGLGPGGPGGGFRAPGGPPGASPGGGVGAGGPGGGNNGYRVDPLVGLYDTSKPLRSKLLAVPKYRAKYLANVRTIANIWLDWKRLGPIVAEQAKMIEAEVQADTRNLSSFADFQLATGLSVEAPDRSAGGSRHSLETFARERRQYLLNHSDISALNQP
jgi:hypothetical protein